jgi:hypothetical protein
MNLRWDEAGRMIYGYAGNIAVGWVSQDPGSSASMRGPSWYWTIDAIDIRWLGKGGKFKIKNHGVVATKAAAQAQIEKTWTRWCEEAGLTPADDLASLKDRIEALEQEAQWGDR